MKGHLKTRPLCQTQSENSIRPSTSIKTMSLEKHEKSMLVDVCEGVASIQVALNETVPWIS
jgi:hypothetical protein